MLRKLLFSSTGLVKLTLPLALFSAVAGGMFFGGSLDVSAQNNSQCTAPDFQITSSKSVSAIAGESFTYFVVTSNDTPYTLDTELPAGLSFTDGKISGTPESGGDYSLQFSSRNDCGQTTQTVSLSVLESSELSQAAGAGASDDGEGSVRLNEIPETGLSADQALTASFYLLALLLLSVLTTQKFRPFLAFAGDRSDDRSSAPMRDIYNQSEPNTAQPRHQVGGEVIDR